MTWLGGATGAEARERRIVFWSGGILLLTGWAAVSITNVAETVFLKRVGVELLPLVFLANSVLLVGTTTLAGRIAARSNHLRLLTWTLTALGVVLMPLWLLVAADVRSTFALLVIAAKQIEAIALLMFWIALGDLLHGRQAKRLYAPIMAGGTLGAIFGSFASAPIGELLGVGSLLPVAGLVLLVGALMTRPLRRLTPPRLGSQVGRVKGPVSSDAPPEPRPGFRSLWREGWLFRALAVSSILNGLLGPMLYFQFSYVADLATQGQGGEQQLLNLYAHFRGWINVAVLIVQVVGTSRIFRHIGIPLASVLSPVVYLIGLTGLSVRLSLPTGVAAVAGARLQDHAVYDPAQKTLFTLFNDQVRAAATAWIDGPLKRGGGVVGNVVIMAALAVGSPIWVGFLGLPVALAWLAVAIGLWRAYPTILLQACSARGSAARDALPLDELIDPGTIRVLESYLVDPDPGHCRAACQLMADGPPDHAVGAMARAARRATDPNRRLILATLDRLLEDAIEAHGAFPDAAREVEGLLLEAQDLDEMDRANLVRIYGRLIGHLQPGPPALAPLRQFIDDPSAAVRLATAGALHRTGAPALEVGDLDMMLTDAISAADACLRHTAQEELRVSLRGVRGNGAAGGGERWLQHLELLATLLGREDDRAVAAAALADIAGCHHGRVAPVADTVLALGEDPDPHVRAAVLRFVGHAGLAKRAKWVVERVTSHDHIEAAAACDALRALGPAAMEALLDALHFGKRSTRNALLPIVHDMNIDQHTLSGLIDTEVAGTRRVLARWQVLRAGGVSELAVQRLHERVAEGLHTALLLLAALLHEDRIPKLCGLLVRANDARARAVLYEALEALLPPERREQLLPLLEQHAAARPDATAPAARDESARDAALRETLHDEDRLTRAFLRATLDAATLNRLGEADGGVDDLLLGSRGLAPGANLDDDGGAGESATSTDGEGASTGAPRAAQKGRMLSPVEIILHLRSLAIFERLSTRQLAELAAVVKEETHPAATAIVREGEFDDCMFLIVEGRVDITKEGRQLAQLGPRDFFGEMAVFDGETRSATGVAATAVHLLRLERQDLFVVMDEQPGIAITICQTLSRRLRELNARIQSTE
jgi:CRP/FNR family cyclic AMP-dependent transcriptional regulator